MKSYLIMIMVLVSMAGIAEAQEPACIEMKDIVTGKASGYCHILDSATTDGKQTVISGTLYSTDKSAADGLTVNAYCDTNSQTNPIKTASTDESGHYSAWTWDLLNNVCSEASSAWITVTDNKNTYKSEIFKLQNADTSDNPKSNDAQEYSFFSAIGAVVALSAGLVLISRKKE